MTLKRIWIAESDLPQLMHNGLVMDAPEDGAKGFVSADIVQELAEALRLALDNHGQMLLTDPPQEAWKARRVEEAARAALARYRGGA